jgi:hypothetical protein
VDRGAQGLAETDLSAKRYVYVWADGIYLQAHLEDEKQCILVLIGGDAGGPQGTRRLHGQRDNARESTQDWRELQLHATHPASTRAAHETR